MKYCICCGYDNHDDCQQYECPTYFQREMAMALKDFRRAQEKALEDYDIRLQYAIKHAKRK